MGNMTNFEIVKGGRYAISPEEEELITRFTAGNILAFEQLFREYYPPLCLFAHMLIKNRQEANALVTEKLFHLWQWRRNFQNDESIRTFLYQQVKDSCIDYLGTNN